MDDYRWALGFIVLIVIVVVLINFPAVLGFFIRILWGILQILIAVFTGLFRVLF